MEQEYNFMKPVGKTYLIEAIKDRQSVINGIIIPDSFDTNDIFYKGIVKAHGTAWTENEIKNLVPIGKKIFMKYGDKKGLKIVIKDKIFYIHDEDHIIATIED